MKLTYPHCELVAVSLVFFYATEFVPFHFTNPGATGENIMAIRQNDCFNRKYLAIFFNLCALKLAIEISLVYVKEHHVKDHLSKCFTGNVVKHL